MYKIAFILGLITGMIACLILFYILYYNDIKAVRDFYKRQEDYKRRI